MGSPCIGNIGRYEKVTAGISMRGEFHLAISTGGCLWLAGTVVTTIARKSARRASCTYYIGRFGHEIITRSRFVSRHVDTGSYKRICYSPEPTEFRKTTHYTESSNFVVCASGDSEAGVRGSTGWNLDRPCSPPHF